MSGEFNSWLHLMRILNSWWRGETPLGGVVMAIVMATLRIAYTGGSRKKMILGGLLCGALTLAFVSCFEYMHLPKVLSIAIGGGIGFVGVDALRSVLLKVIKCRFGVDK